MFVNADGMEDVLHELTGTGEGEFKDRGSRFLAFAYPVREGEAVDAAIAYLRKTYYDARHHCYGYRLGRKGETAFAADDGEPSHSAGAPILGAIRSASLTNTLVVVIRYFGGTKLGVRGLIEAYRTATESALEKASREVIIPQIVFSLDYSYEQTSLISRLIHPFDLQQLDASYTDRCQQTFAIHEAEFSGIQQSLEQAGFSLTDVHSPE